MDCGKLGVQMVKEDRYIFIKLKMLKLIFCKCKGCLSGESNAQMLEQLKCLSKAQAPEVLKR